MRLLLISAALLLAAAPGGARDRQVPEAVPDGKPLDCVRSIDILTTHVRSDEVIDFEMRNRKIYRNTLPIGCPRLGFEERFLYKTSISQLCSVDTITVLTSGGGGPGGLGRGATCGLGVFQPVTLVKPAKK